MAKKLLPSEAPSSLPDNERRLRQAERLARLMRLLQLLLSRGRWNSKDLAAEQECSERTVYRDLQVLGLAGIFADFDKNDGSYHIRPDFRFPVMNLTEEEIIAQGTATAISSSLALAIDVGTKAVSQKIAASSKEDIAHLLADAQELITVLDLKLADHSRHRDIIQTIQRALVRHKQITGIYRSPYRPKEQKVILHPYRLCLVKAAWYLIARSTQDNYPKTYRVQRFKSLHMSEAKALIPEDFDLKAYFGNAWAVFRCGQIYDVELLFTKEVAALAMEVIWHHTQKVQKHQDGSLTMTFQVDGLSEILRWILIWSGSVIVVKPKELRTMIIDLHHRAITLHEKL